MQARRRIPRQRLAGGLILSALVAAGCHGDGQYRAGRPYSVARPIIERTERPKTLVVGGYAGYNYDADREVVRVPRTGP